LIIHDKKRKKNDSGSGSWDFFLLKT